MPTSRGILKPFVSINRSADLYNTVNYQLGGNVSTSTDAIFTASFAGSTTLIYVTYVTAGQIVPGMSLYGLGIPNGTIIVGPLNINGTGTGGVGSYTISLNTTLTSAGWNGSASAIAGYNNSVTLGNSITGTSATLAPTGPGGVVGPVPGYNCVNIMDIRNYYNIPYPPANQSSSAPVIAIVSFGGGIYGRSITSGQYAGFWKCDDIAGSNGTPIQILVNPINGAINAPNADDDGATLENTVDVATVSAFYGMIDPRRDAPIYTPPIIILYIAPSADISEMYRTFYTVLKNPVICNGKSYMPSVVSCSWGSPEIAWTQKMPFPPNPSIQVDNSPNPEGIAELNEINDLFAEATKNGINICCASGDIPLNTVNASVNTYNYAQALLLQGQSGNGYGGQTPAPQPSVFPLTDAERASLPPPQVMFPASSPYVTCVGGSAVYFPSINSGSYDNPAEFAWTRANGGISSVFSIPAYQQNLPGSASTSAAQFLATSLNTANLATIALGTPVPSFDPISGAYTAPNTGVTLATQTKEDVYNNTLAAFNSAKEALEAAQLSSADDALMNSLVQVVKDASTALSTAESNKNLAEAALKDANDLVVKTQTVSELLVNAGTVFGARAKSVGAFTDDANGSVYTTQQALLNAKRLAQTAAYNQLVTPNTANLIALQNANEALQAAQAAADASELAAMTLPQAVDQTTTLAIDAISQSAAAVVSPSLSTHPYLDEMPLSSPIVPVSNLAYKAAQAPLTDLPYDATLTSASSYLLTAIGTGYTAPNVNTSVGTIRGDLNAALTAADNLVMALANVPSTDNLPTNGTRGTTAILTDSTIVSSIGQLQASGSYATAATAWKNRHLVAEMLPVAGTSYDASGFAVESIALAKSGATTISTYASGANSSSFLGYKLPCGLASAAASSLAAVYPVSNDELNADISAGNPFGTTDTSNGTVSAGSYNGITTPLINLRNIYANTTLATRRTITATNAAHAAKDAFLAWSSANEAVNKLQVDATSLYNSVPVPSNNSVREMNDALLRAKTLLSSATYDLGVAENYAVTTARLAQQSTASASVFMGNTIMTTFDQLGNLNAVPYNDISTYQGANNANCPLIAQFSSGTTANRNTLKAAQALIQAATNDNYLSSTVLTNNVHMLTGVDSSGSHTITYTGTRMLVNDAQFAAAGAAGQVANIAFADATESLARFTDWQNIALIANQALTATGLVYTALQDASSNSMPNDASGNSPLIQAVNAATSTVALVIAATTPYNQQATASATIATNDVVVLAAKLETLSNVCQAAQAAIQLAASTYLASGSSNISGQANGGGGSIFTVNMAYAKVTADAAAAAATAAAILAREDAVLAARRANYSALALQKLVGTGTIGNAIAGFLDASGNLVSQTGYGKDGSGNPHPLPNTNGGSGTVNGIVPPAVSQSTVLYQGTGSTTPIQTNLTYTAPASTNVYSAVSRLVTNAQSVLSVLDNDASGNTVHRSDLYSNYVSYPNVRASNALNTTLSDSSGSALSHFQTCLLAAYEAQQWVVASANATFVTFGSSPANVNLVTFTPSLLGVINKLDSDANNCLETMLNAEGAILYSMSQRPNPVALHDFDAANFAAAFNANQSAADTYLALTNSAILNVKNALITLHLGDLANALSPLAANVATAAGQASALGGMAFSSPQLNPNYSSNTALSNANFPLNGWGGSSQPTLLQNPSSQYNNSTNPNPGPYNGTSTGAAPFPALYSSPSSRIPSPAATILQQSATYLGRKLSHTTLAASKAAADLAASALAFNNLLVEVSTVTPSLVDSATLAANSTLLAAQTSNFALNPNVTNPSGGVFSPASSAIARLLENESNLILEAAESAKANLEAITTEDERYISRENMLNLWNKCIRAMKNLMQAVMDAPLYYPDYKGDPTLIVPALLGNVGIMGATNSTDSTPNNSAPIWNSTIVDASNNPFISYTTDNYSTITPSSASTSKPSLLSLLNEAVINAYNATTGCPDSSGNSRYVNFILPGSSSLVTNYAENINDTNQAYNNAVAVLNANSQIANVAAAAVLKAQVAIQAAYDAASAAAAANLPTILPAPTGIITPNGGSDSIVYTTEGTNVKSAVTSVVTSDPFVTGHQSAVTLAYKVSQELWNQALIQCNTMCQRNPDGTYPNISLDTLFQLMSLVGLNLARVQPSTVVSQSQANATNLQITSLITGWAKASNATGSWNPYLPSSNLSISTSQGAFNAGYASNNSYTFTQNWLDLGVHAPLSSITINSASITIGRWSAFFWTAAISDPASAAYQTAYAAWQAVLIAVNSYPSSQSTAVSSLQTNAANSATLQSKSIYSMKIALQSAERANVAALKSMNSTSLLATSTNTYEDLAAAAATEAASATTSNLNFYRCVPDIAMHANADDLPVIYKLNGGNVYVGGTSISTAMFAGFLGVVQAHNPINYFVNPILYDNYTFPSPLFNDISGSLQVWYPGGPGGSTVPPRIANILPGLKSPLSGLGSGIYNCNIGLGSIKGANLAALMELPEVITYISPQASDHQAVVVYPGTTATIIAYVEPITAYNPNVTWETSSQNIYVSQTNNTNLSNNGINDTNPYTQYNPLISDSSGNQLAPSLSIGDYSLGSVGNVKVGTNPFHLDSSNNPMPCLIFTATVIGVTQVFSGSPLPIITMRSTDGSSVFGSYQVNVLPPIQVTGVSISSLNETHNPANTVLYLGTTLQLVANVTPLTATNKEVYWWSSNTSVVNVDTNGLLTPLVPGQVTIKATSLNNNISASISVYVPVPITGISVLPSTITLNPNMAAYPLKNLGVVKAIVQPENADYKYLTWEIISSTQVQPAPTGISDVVSVPRNGTIISRNSNGEITDNTQATITAISNGISVIKVSTHKGPYDVYGSYYSTINVNVVTPVTSIVMTQSNMVINLSPESADGTILPESYKVTATFKPAYPSNMNVYWSSSNPKVAVISNNSIPVLNTITSDPNFGLWQITETVTPLSNGTAVIKVTTADGQKTDTTTVVVTTPVTGLSMSALPVILNPTRSYTLQATVIPATATNTELLWKSTNTTIATVDSNGVVKAISSGSCGISVTSVDGDYSAITEVSVVTNLIGVQLVVNTPLPIHVNDVVQILVVMVPTTASNQQFTWTISGGSLAQGPSQNGNIVYLDAIQAGSGVFTVTTADGNKQASVNLTVVNW
jgi:uncharacterized protein YjdB